MLPASLCWRNGRDPEGRLWNQFFRVSTRYVDRHNRTGLPRMWLRAKELP